MIYVSARKASVCISNSQTTYQQVICTFKGMIQENMGSTQIGFLLYFLVSSPCCFPLSSSSFSPPKTENKIIGHKY